MGFGILFFGCFLTYIGALATPVSTYTYVLGSALMLFALYKLSDQNKLFIVSTAGSAILVVVSLVVLGLSLFGAESGAFYNVTINVQVFLSPILLCLLLSAIFLIAREVGLRKIQGWCIVDGIFVCIYLICDIVSRFVSGASFARLGMVCIIAQALYSVLMIIIVFNCYARICYDDDKNMEKETTGVPVFDFLNKQFDKATNKGRKNGPKNKGGK